MATANNRKAFTPALLVSITTLSLALAACATQPAQKTAQNPEPATAETVVDETVIVDDFEGDGMEIPLDGSSVEAFDASLEMVKRHTDEVHYETLQSAITYLLVYDLGADRSREKLAKRLDGLNGYQVIEKVGWRKPRPGKSPVEKGAADAKIIDT